MILSACKRKPTKRWQFDRVDILYTREYALPIKLIEHRFVVSNGEEMRAIYVLCNRALQRKRYCLALDGNDKKLARHIDPHCADNATLYQITVD